MRIEACCTPELPWTPVPPTPGVPVPPDGVEKSGGHLRAWLLNLSDSELTLLVDSGQLERHVADVRRWLSVREAARGAGPFESLEFLDRLDARIAAIHRTGGSLPRAMR